MSSAEPRLESVAALKAHADHQLQRLFTRGVRERISGDAAEAAGRARQLGTEYAERAKKEAERLYNQGLERAALIEDQDRSILPGMEPATKDYVDLKLEAAMSRIDAKLEAIRDNQISPWQVWGAALTGFGAVLAVLAFGGDQFGLGSSLADQRLEQLQRDQAQNERIEATLSRVDAFLAAQATQPAPTPENPSE